MEVDGIIVILLMLSMVHFLSYHIQILNCFSIAFFLVSVNSNFAFKIKFRIILIYWIEYKMKGDTYCPQMFENLGNMI